MRIPVFTWLFLVPMCTLFLNLCVFVVAHQCLGNQQFLLLELKNNLIFNSTLSTKLAKWNQSVDCCSWEGITCNEGRVIGLDLTNEFISGGLNNSSSLFSLQHLQSLSLAYNHFNNSQIPSELDRLANLSYLDLSYSYFAGQIPIAISRLTRLVTLDLSSYYFSLLKLENPNLNVLVQNLSELMDLYLDGVLISSQGNEWCQALSSSLPNLRDLSLSKCNLSGPFDFSLRNLQSLSFISLYGNNFSTPVPEFFADFKSLTYLDLSNSGLNREFPTNIFEVPMLQTLDLSYNDLRGSLPEFSPNGSLQTMILSQTNFSGSLPPSIGNLKMLSKLDLWGCNFNGSIPSSMAGLTQLVYLEMSNNNFSGSIPDSIASLTQLVYLDMSDNSFSGSIPISLFSLPSLQTLDLSRNQFSGLLKEFSNVSSCKLKFFPDFLRNQSSLRYLDLSYNQIYGGIPNWIWKLPNCIPISICNATKLEVLDLSNNSFFGTIPKCLIEMSGKVLGVLNLRTNNLNGTIPDAFPHNCGLQTLVLNKNHLEGGLPKSLANCSRLEVLDIGNNHIEGTFPFYLKNTFMLKVLVLRSNKFYGPITHPELNATWPMLQIVDVTSNNFTGNLPIILLSTWRAMMDHAPENQLELGYRQNSSGFGFYYRDTVTITIKGLEMELVKILKIFTTIDFSCNNFKGPIPEEIGEFKLLHILNLSHNAFTGQIPSSLGKLSNLESLDLSSNELSGKIPIQLADGLIFLSILNLSFNQLVGRIPLTKQFATFLETSFEGNEKLCGFPLKSQCTYEQPRLLHPTYEGKHWNSGIVIEWNYISAELGFVFGFGIILGPLMFWKRWRIWYYKYVDDILFRIFHGLYLGKEYHQRRRYRN